MSRKSEAKRSLNVANKRLSGSYSTKAFRKAEVERLIEWCFINQYLINSIIEIDARMIKDYLYISSIKSNELLDNLFI